MLYIKHRHMLVNTCITVEKLLIVNKKVRLNHTVHKRTQEKQVITFLSIKLTSNYYYSLFFLKIKIT